MTVSTICAPGETLRVWVSELSRWCMARRGRIAASGRIVYQVSIKRNGRTVWINGLIQESIIDTPNGSRGVWQFVIDSSDRAKLP